MIEDGKMKDRDPLSSIFDPRKVLYLTVEQP
jgi:hypothetical protein